MTMNDQEISRVILQKLHDLLVNGKASACLKPIELANELGLDIKTVEIAVRALIIEGHAKSLTMAPCVQITPEGVKALKGSHGAHPVDTHFHQTIKVNGNNAGQINVAHTINNPSLFLMELAEAVEKLPDLEPEKKSRWKATLLEISKHPALIAAMIRLLSPGG
jgi:hypothetical protein